MMGAKKYDVLKRFAAGPRTNLELRTKDANKDVPWCSSTLCSMGFLDVRVERVAEGGATALTFTLTEDGRVYLQGAGMQIEEEYGKGAV